jgi:hypothetical protein
MKIISNMNCLSLVNKPTSYSGQDIIVRDVTKDVKWKCEVPTVIPSTFLWITPCYKNPTIHEPSSNKKPPMWCPCNLGQ